LEKIIIHNLGPIEYIEFNINDFNVLIGPQASGKSTLAKAIYFFKSLAPQIELSLVRRARSPQRKLGQISMRANAEKFISDRFISFWGVNKLKRNTIIHYFYTPQNHVKVDRNEDGSIQTTFSPTIESKITEAQEEFDAAVKSIKDDDGSGPKIWGDFTDIVHNIFLRIFGEGDHPTYLPAGRSAASVLPGTVTMPSDIIEDEILADFYRLRFRIFRWFDQGFEGVRKRLILQGETEKRMNAVEKFWNFSKDILKGEFKTENNSPRIYFGDEEDDFVQLSLASSGQQEALWIVVVLFYLLVQVRRKKFIVIEEPEAHLFPITQRDITKLISYFFQNTNSQIIITTHSPYMLSSANNLLLAHSKGMVDAEKTTEIMDSAFWLKPERVGAYFIEHGSMRSIIDSDLKMIRVEEIDKVSSQINSDFDRLEEINA
jgi:AAA15 family ATPase/GTPase